MQTVYVDLYFLINFSMDFLCLYLTAKLLSERLSLPRGLIAAALGGLYANAALLLSLGEALSIGADIAACAVICAVAFFRRREWKRLPLYVLIYTAVSVALGGFMTALFYLFNRTGIFSFIRESDGDGISVWLFALLALISGAITLLGGRGFTKRMSAKGVELRITYGGRAVTVHGITDSGNMLRDPIGGKPCIVVDREKMKNILPRSLLELSEKGGLSGLERLGAQEKRRIVLIPASTVSGSDMLVGVRVDGVSIRANGKRREADAVVALSELSEGALVPSCLLI